MFDRDILNGNDSCLSVRIHECRPTTIHAKTFVVDGAWSAVGTMNFDNRSLACNDGIALVALDDTVGRGASGLEGDRPAVRVS